MKDILDARNEINEIDKQMAQLFQKRMEAVKDVAVYKRITVCPSAIFPARRKSQNAIQNSSRTKA